MFIEHLAVPVGQGPVTFTLGVMGDIAFRLICLVLVASAAHASPSSHVAASQLKAEIRASGAKAVLLKYYDTPAWSASVMPGIRSAAPDWLAVAEQLKSVADAAASEDLGLAFYDALAVAPFRVVPLLTRVYGGSVEDVCNVSFEAEVPKQGVKVYLNGIRAKLVSPKTDEQKAMAVACMRGLDQSQAAASAQGLQ